MDALATVRRRLHEQRLAGNHLDSPAEGVGWLGAMQAQEFDEAKWSLAERMGGASDAEIEEAFSRGEILRTHVLRPTWHFVTPEDIRWMLSLTAPRIRKAVGYYYRRHGLEEDLFARTNELLAEALAAGEPLTRKELGEALAGAGVEANGSQLAHIVMQAEVAAIACSGPRRGKQHTYMLLEERVPRARELSREDALAELTLRYFTSHGPATLKDFGWWSGLTMKDARAGLAAAGDRIAELDEGWYAAPGYDGKEGSTGARLIPMFDETTVAYQDLRVVLKEDPPGRLPLDRPIVIEGRTVGSWKRILGKGEVEIEASLFAPLAPQEDAALGAAIDRFGTFLGLPARLTRR